MKAFGTRGDQVAVLPKQRVERVTKRGVILPAELRDPFVMWGEVLSHGKGHVSPVNGERQPMHVQPGDKILYLREAVRHTYERVTVAEVEHAAICIVQQRDINLVVRNDEIIPLNDYIVGKIEKSEYDFEEIYDKITRTTYRAYGKYIDIGDGKTLFMPTQMVDEKMVSTEKKPIRVRANYVGPGRRADNGKLIPLDLTVGDLILVSRYMAWEFMLDEKDDDTGYVVIKADQIYGIETAAE